MSAALQFPSSFDGIAAIAWTLAPPGPGEKKDVLRDEAGFLLDGLLVRVARSQGAIDVAIGELLADVGTGDRALRLGFSRVGDYARERLGIAASTAQKLVRLAVGLRDRPLLREAVRSGEVTARKAETILRVARGDDEAGWVARAKIETVRSLKAAVQAAIGDGSGPEEDEPWARYAMTFTSGPRAKLDEAMGLAGKLLGATSPKWQRVEAVGEEYLGEYAGDVEEDEAPGGSWSGAEGADVRALGGVADDADLRARIEALPLDPYYPRDVPQVRAWLEEETRNWEFLETIAPVPAPAEFLCDGPYGVGTGAGVGALPSDEDPWRAERVRRDDPAWLDASLLRLADMRRRWDDLFGHLAMLLRMLGLWRDMKFVSFAHYCSERLGMGERTVSQRIALERKLYEFPQVRTALHDGRLSYEKARDVVRVATDRTVDEWIERADELTCVTLAREVEAKQEAQMCAQDELCLWMPVRVRAVLDQAFRAVRSVRAVQNGSQGRLTDEQCLEILCDHFISVWKPLLAERNTVQKRVLDRDGGRCQVPGCTREALHVHHVRFRSRGGGDEEWNLVSLCPAHHLHAVHKGWLRVSGRAPGGLTWVFKNGGGPVVARNAAAHLAGNDLGRVAGGEVVAMA